MSFCVHENDMVTIRFSKNKFYDVMAPFFVHDVVALNNIACQIRQIKGLAISAGKDSQKGD